MSWFALDVVLPSVLVTVPRRGSPTPLSSLVQHRSLEEPVPRAPLPFASDGAWAVCDLVLGQGVVRGRSVGRGAG